MTQPLLHPDDPHLDELLDRALAAGPMRASLVDDVLAATLPLVGGARKAMLDAALAPDQPPTGLVRRVLRATEPVLYRRRHPVIGFIGATPAYRVAAGILLAAMLGIWATMASIAADARDLARIETRLANLSTLAATDTSLDRRFHDLDDDLHNLQLTTAWDAGGIVPDDADAWVIGAPVNEMPWLF